MNAVAHRLRPADLIILAAGIIGVALTWTQPWAGSQDHGAPRLIVYTEGGQRELPLDADGRYTLLGPRGPSVVELRDGAVRFLESPCRGQLCVLRGWIAGAGAYSACLPNRISLEIAGDGRFDSINH